MNGHESKVRNKLKISQAILDTQSYLKMAYPNTTTNRKR